MEFKPIVFNTRREAPSKAKELDVFTGSIRELFFIRNPQFKDGMPQAEKPLAEFFEKNKNAIENVWIYYPWLNKIVHCPAEDIFFEIKTARNKNFITESEQKGYRDFKIGIMGMSIGSNVLWPLIASGGPKFLRIADADTIEISNLNRMLAPLTAAGENKAAFMAKKIYEMDPFLKVDYWTNFVDEGNMSKFISGLDLLVDEIDGLSLKFSARNIAKKLRIPVIMVTNVGNNVVLDVERFDREPKRPIFHGLMKGVQTEQLSNMTYKRWVEIATKIVDPKYLDNKMKSSLKSIGKKTASVPQISSTALIAGSIATQAVMRMAAKRPLKSGRYFFDIDNHFKVC
ncbi:MAG: ThiF family adenylyltransferase [Candidatus Nealsonbacteria bacterium]|nr:ThiF family adenylyltransferase [Candidatus Nealsonbacteria bacterium]